MNFKNKKSIDMLATIRLSGEETKDLIQNGFTIHRRHAFNKSTIPTALIPHCLTREKPGRLDIQASQFYRHRRLPCPLPVKKRDPHPHLYCSRIPASRGHYNLCFFNEKYSSADYINNLFLAAEKYTVCNIAGRLHVTAYFTGVVRKGHDQYYVPIASVEPIKWRPDVDTLNTQDRLTRECLNDLKE